MEPRPCGRGNFMPILTRGWQFSCFNGATTLRSWKPPHHSPMVGLIAHGFNGATTLRSWKPGAAQGAEQAPEASMEPRPCGRGNVSTATAIPTAGEGFNGATTLRSWKPRLLHPMAAAQSASMEPRPCGRGNALIAQGERIPARSFNGATTLRSWKLGINLTSGGRVQMLQWSHDLAVVETRNRRTRRRTG